MLFSSLHSLGKKLILAIDDNGRDRAGKRIQKKSVEIIQSEISSVMQFHKNSFSCRYSGKVLSAQLLTGVSL